MEPKYLATVFNVWALGTMPLLLNRLLSLDGKSIKCTSSGGNTSAQNFTSFVSVFAAPTQLLAKWTGLKSVIMVNRAGVRARKSSSETVYYLSSQSLTANTYATFSGEASPEKLAYMRLIRGHWAIENRLHWVKDVTFDEDYPSRTGGHAPVNWAILFTLIVTLVRRAGIRTVPQALRLWANQVEAVFSFLV